MRGPERFAPFEPLSKFGGTLCRGFMTWEHNNRKEQNAQSSSSGINMILNDVYILKCQLSLIFVRKIS